VKKAIIRKAPVAKVIGKPAVKPARAMKPDVAQVGAGAGIGTAPPKFVPQKRKR
jgi:hypothetical protein